MNGLWGAIAGAVATGAVGALGFLFNSLVLQPASKRRDARQQSIIALQDLSSLLAISFDTFRNQNFKAQMLLDSVQHNHPEIPTSKPDGTSLGYDEIFHNAHHVLTSDEMELFQLIRGTTLTSLHDTNSKMQKWIEDHSQFLVGVQPNETRAQLGNKLVQLRTHLNEWSAKYAVWIPNDHTRALVYLADEKGHGSPFPEHMDEAVNDVLGTLERGA